MGLVRKVKQEISNLNKNPENLINDIIAKYSFN